MKSIWKKILVLLGSAVFIVIVIAYCGVGILGLLRTVYQVIQIAGGGSFVLGIFIIPFFIFGAIQIFRGFFALAEADERKFTKAWHGSVYLLCSILGYLAVLYAIVN